MDACINNHASVRMIEESELKADCLKLIHEVADSGTEIVIARDGRPIALLVPCRKQPKSLFGIDRGRLDMLGDVDAPLNVAWEAATDEVQEGS